MEQTRLEQHSSKYRRMFLVGKGGQNKAEEIKLQVAPHLQVAYIILQLQILVLTQILIKPLKAHRKMVLSTKSKVPGRVQLLLTPVVCSFILNFSKYNQCFDSLGSKSW